MMREFLARVESELKHASAHDWDGVIASVGDA